MPETETDVVMRHVERICDEAGLGVMVQVYEILLNREIEEGGITMLTLDADDVQRHYFNVIGPAIDTIETFLEERT